MRYTAKKARKNSDKANSKDVELSSILKSIENIASTGDTNFITWIRNEELIKELKELWYEVNKQYWIIYNWFPSTYNIKR